MDNVAFCSKSSKQVATLRVIISSFTTLLQLYFFYKLTSSMECKATKLYVQLPIKPKKKEHGKEPLRTGKLSGARETRMNLHLLIEREEKFFLDQSPSTSVGLWWPRKRFLVVCFITTALPIIEQAECANGNRRRTDAQLPFFLLVRFSSAVLISLSPSDFSCLVRVLLHLKRSVARSLSKIKHKIGNFH